MKTKFLLLLTVLLCGATSVWALTPVGTDEWNDGTKTLTVKSNPTDHDYPNSDEIQHIVFADAVTEIVSYAFIGCENLTSVTFGSGLTTIGSMAFQGSGLTAVTFPDNLTSIGSMAFQGCSNLSSVVFGSNLTSIGSQAFYGTSLTMVTIPANVTSIGGAAFYGSGFTAFNVDTGNTTYMSAGGVLFSKDGTTLLVYPAGKTETSYDIPSTVTSIGATAFGGTTFLTSVNIPASITTIADYAFSGCYALTEITVDGGNANYEAVDGVLFSKGGATLLAYPSQKTATSYEIPSTVTSIGTGAFGYCDYLTTVSIPNSVSTIGEQAFQGCGGITSIVIPTTVTSIGDYAFNGCTGMTDVYYYADPKVTGLTWNGKFDFKESRATTFHVKKTDNDISYLEDDIRAIFVSELWGDGPVKANQGDKAGEYWATYHNSDVVKVGSSTKVYKAALGPTSVTLTEIPDGIINSDEGVILKSTEPMVHIFWSSDPSDYTYSGNEMRGVDVETDQATDEIYLVLSKVAPNGVGFYPLESGVKLGAHKAFISIPVSTPVRAYYGFGEDGGETGIAGLPAETELSGEAWYDLSGRRLEGKPAAKGIYVKNGRKYLVK